VLSIKHWGWIFLHTAKLIGAAIRDNPGFIELRKLEAARDIASTLSKSSNRLFLDGGSLLLDVKEQTTFKLGAFSSNSPEAVAVEAAPVVAAPVVAAPVAPTPSPNATS